MDGWKDGSLQDPHPPSAPRGSRRTRGDPRLAGCMPRVCGAPPPPPPPRAHTLVPGLHGRGQGMQKSWRPWAAPLRVHATPSTLSCPGRRGTARRWQTTCSSGRSVMLSSCARKPGAAALPSAKADGSMKEQASRRCVMASSSCKGLCSSTSTPIGSPTQHVCGGAAPSKFARLPPATQAARECQRRAMASGRRHAQMHPPTHPPTNQPTHAPTLAHSPSSQVAAPSACGCSAASIACHTSAPNRRASALA